MTCLHKPANHGLLADAVNSLLEQRKAQREEIERLRRRMYALERVIARFIPVERETDPAVGPNDRLAIITARDRYEKRQKRVR